MELEQEIVRIFRPVRPRRVILFGSRARAEDDAYSDVDLIVVYETPKRFLDRLAELYLLWDLPMAVDILAYTPEEFVEMSESNAFVREAVAHGRVLREEIP
jgi:predicted nucleotidyltransferase